MPRILVGLAPSILILVTCSWLVHLEGESYRRQFRDTARDQLTKRLVQGELPHANVPMRPSVIEEEHAGSITDAGHTTPGVSPGPIVQEEPGHASQATIETPGSKTVERSPEPIEIVRTSPPPIETPAPTPPKRHHWPVDPIQCTDPLKLTHDEEAQVGKAVYDVILQHHQVQEEPEFQNRLYRLSMGLEPPKDSVYKFYVLDSRDPIAFSHLGGYIYLDRSLANLVADDIELEFIIAHEMAHLELRHGVTQVAKTMDRKSAGQPDQPGLVQRLYHQIAVGYDDSQEFAADKWAGQRLMELRRSPHGILSFLRRLEKYANHDGVRNGRVSPVKPETPLEAEIQDVEKHWRTHPAMPLRLGRLQELIDGRPANRGQ